MRTAGSIPKSWYESPWLIAGRAVSIALVVTVLALIAALLVVPRVAGGSSLTVLTGSMQPTLAPGDIVAVRGVAPDAVCTEIGVGDIVTYLPEPGNPTLVTHRVVGKTVGTFDDGTPCRLITQGDANSAADAPVSPVQVRGAMLYSLPALGWVRQWAVENIVALSVALGVGLLGYGAWTTFRRPRTRVIMTSGSGSVGAAAASAATSAADGLRTREPVTDQVDGVLADMRRRTRRATFIAWILALVLLLTLAGALSAAGVLPSSSAGPTSAIATTGESTGIAPAPASEAGSQSWDAVAEASWDGPATHLDWSNRGYSTAESSFVGRRVAAPGDRTVRTLMVTNAGPARAGLAVSLHLDEGIPGGARNPALADDVELFWNVGGVEGRQPFSALLERSAGAVEIAQVQVARGEAVVVEIGFELPSATTQQRNEGQPSTELAFDVVATMSGEVDQQPDRLATTGAGSLLLFGIAAALLMLVGLLLIARRRRRCDACARTLGHDESWVDLADHGPGRCHVCPDCAPRVTTAAGSARH